MARHLLSSVPAKHCGERFLFTVDRQVIGREQRLPLHLQGLGLGPKATWLYDTLDVGDVYVNSQHRYEVVIENHGQIPASYALQPNTSLFASKFTFSPTAGKLNPTEQVPRISGAWLPD